MPFEIWETTTSIKDDTVVSIRLIDSIETYKKILSNLHISRFREINETLVSVETDGTFRRFYDTVYMD